MVHVMVTVGAAVAVRREVRYRLPHTLGTFTSQVHDELAFEIFRLDMYVAYMMSVCMGVYAVYVHQVATEHQCGDGPGLDRAGSGNGMQLPTEGGQGTQRGDTKTPVAKAEFAKRIRGCRVPFALGLGLGLGSGLGLGFRVSVRVRVRVRVWVRVRVRVRIRVRNTVRVRVRVKVSVRAKDRARVRVRATIGRYRALCDQVDIVGSGHNLGLGRMPGHKHLRSSIRYSDPNQAAAGIPTHGRGAYVMAFIPGRCGDTHHTRGLQGLEHFCTNYSRVIIAHSIATPI